MSESERVVVVGAGPVGLTAALILARANVPVTVLEAEPGLTRDLRAGTFHPPTLQLLDELGIAERMHRPGIIVRHWQVRDRQRGVIADFDLSLIQGETPYPYRLHLEQHRVTPMLLADLQKIPGVEVRFGARLDGLTLEDDRVTLTLATSAGQERLQARWVIGADGGRSVVRKSVNIEFEGFTWPERFLVASTSLDLEPFGFRYASYVSDPDLWAAVFKVPDEAPPGLWRIAYPTNPEIPEERVLADDAIQASLRTIQPLPQAWPLLYRSTYRVHQRVAASFRAGRVLLAGDAAHVNNPLGGFGLNGGIQDAANLAEKLARVWHGRGSESLLDLYDRQRRPINIEFVQAMSIRNKRLIEERDPAVRAERLAELSRIAADPVRAKAYLMDSSMITSMRKAASIE